MTLSPLVLFAHFFLSFFFSIPRWLLNVKHLFKLCAFFRLLGRFVGVLVLQKIILRENIVGMPFFVAAILGSPLSVA